MIETLHDGKIVATLQATAASGECVSVSVVRMSSGRPGPTLVVIAAMHGTEYASVAALGRLVQSLRAEDIAGTLVLVPVANELAFETRTMCVSPRDQKNLNRSFPGKPDGTYTEVLAHLIWSNVVSGADCVIDVHGGEIVEGLVPFTGAYRQARRPETGELSRKAAEAFHPAYLVLNTIADEIQRANQRISLVATDAGIPSVLVEAGSRGGLEESDIRFIHDGVVNVMRLLRMIDEPLQLTDSPSMVVREEPVFASTRGLFHSRVKPGDSISPGMELGEIVDYLGRPVERFTSCWDGVVLGVIGPAMVKGRMPLVIGVSADGWAPHQPL